MNKSIRTLPEKLGEVWQLGLRQVEVDGTLRWGLLIVSATTDSLLPDRMIVAYDILSKRPSSKIVGGYIRRAICLPRHGTPCRPSCILLSARADSVALTRYIQSLGVQVACRKPYGCWQRVFRRVSAHVADPVMPADSLLFSPGMDVPSIGQFFSTANAFANSFGSASETFELPEAAVGPAWSTAVCHHRSPRLYLIERSPRRQFSSFIDMQRHSVTLGVRFDGRRWWSPAAIRDLELCGIPISKWQQVPYPYRSNPGGTFRVPLAWEVRLLQRAMLLSINAATKATPWLPRLRGSSEDWT